MKTIALIISVIFHPLFMATYGCLLIFFVIRDTIFDYMTPPGTKWSITFWVFLFSLVFPVINIVVLYLLKRIQSMRLSNPTERTFPYLMTSMFYFGLFYLLKDVNIWLPVKLFVLGGGLAILITALINLKFKISAHMVGIGGLFGALISLSYLIKFDMTLFYIACIIIAGLVGMARLILKEHKPLQVYTGFLLGLVIQTGLFVICETLNFN